MTDTLLIVSGVLGIVAACVFVAMFIGSIADARQRRFDREADDRREMLRLLRNITAHCDSVRGDMTKVRLDVRALQRTADRNTFGARRSA